MVVLCEDLQHAAFARRFLSLQGWETRKLRFDVAPAGRQSAEKWVRERFPIELNVYRRQRNHLALRLMVLIDADATGHAGRLQQLSDACQAVGERPREHQEDVGVFVPARNIESWLAYLDGNAIDEETVYQRLTRESDCGRHAAALHAMCNAGALREPAPPSLVAACVEYRVRMAT